MAAPSLSHLASALSKPGTPGPGTEPRIAFARPEPMLRVGLVATLGLLIAVGAGTLALAWGLQNLVVAVREQRGERRFQEREALPSPAILLDRVAYLHERAQRPLAAPVLLAARSRALAHAGRWSEVVAEVEDAEMSFPLDINPTARLFQAEALWRTGETVRAGAALHAIDTNTLEEQDRARAAELAGLLWLNPAGSKRPESTLRPAEDPDQTPPKRVGDGGAGDALP